MTTTSYSVTRALLARTGRRGVLRRDVGLVLVVTGRWEGDRRDGGEHVVVALDQLQGLPDRPRVVEQGGQHGGDVVARDGPVRDGVREQHLAHAGVVGEPAGTQDRPV